MFDIGDSFFPSSPAVTHRLRTWSKPVHRTDGSDTAAEYQRATWCKLLIRFSLCGPLPYMSDGARGTWYRRLCLTGQPHGPAGHPQKAATGAHQVTTWPARPRGRLLTLHMMLVVRTTPVHVRRGSWNMVPSSLPDCAAAWPCWAPTEGRHRGAPGHDMASTATRSSFGDMYEGGILVIDGHTRVLPVRTRKFG